MENKADESRKPQQPHGCEDFRIESNAVIVKKKQEIWNRKAQDS